jgi:hypothetical protein
MIRITTAVDRRLGFGYSNRQPEFTQTPGLATRLELFRQKLLKKAIQIELDELDFWIKEINRSQVDFQTARMLAQRIRTLCDGIPYEYLPKSHESDVNAAVHRHAIAHAKHKLGKLQEEAVSGDYPYGDTRVDFLRFIRTYNVSLEDLDCSKVQFRQLTQQANLAWEKTYEEYLRRRAQRKQA